jgi:hypothetical protein
MLWDGQSRGTLMNVFRLAERHKPVVVYVQARRMCIEVRGDRELRVSVLQIGAEVHELRVKVEQNSADIRDLSTRMAVLSRLEERVAALEKRTA